MKRLDLTVDIIGELVGDRAIGSLDLVERPHALVQYVALLVVERIGYLIVRDEICLKLAKKRANFPYHFSERPLALPCIGDRIRVAGELSRAIAVKANESKPCCVGEIVVERFEAVRLYLFCRENALRAVDRCRSFVVDLVESDQVYRLIDDVCEAQPSGSMVVDRDRGALGDGAVYLYKLGISCPYLADDDVLIILPDRAIESVYRLHGEGRSCGCRGSGKVRHVRVLDQPSILNEYAHVSCSFLPLL